MRISKERSGGRGEYEICEQHGDLKPQDLFDRRILIELPNGSVVDTQAELRLAQGKRRIRLIGGAQTTHPARQAAAILLMPKGHRDETKFGEGEPILRTEQYGITDLVLSDVQLVASDRVCIRIGDVHITNAYTQDTINFVNRFKRIQAIWADRDTFGDEIADLLGQHETIVNSGNPVNLPAERLVRQLQRVVAESADDFGVYGNAPTADVLPSLLQILGGVVPEPAEDMEAVSQQEAEIRRRVAKEYRHWAACRGADSAKFRRKVREAYNATCAICGLRFPPTSSNKNPGVDAAHILPWSQYDLDSVSNGICLCKQHHWAFDESLIGIQYEDGSYFVEINEEAEQQIQEEDPDFSLDYLREHVGEIPSDRLPNSRDDRPRPEFLAELYQATV